MGKWERERKREINGLRGQSREEESEREREGTIEEGVRGKW